MLYRSRLGVTLNHQNTSQRPAVFAGDLLPHRLTNVITKCDTPVRLRRVEKNTPAVVRHFHVVIMGPAFALDTDRGAKVNVMSL